MTKKGFIFNLSLTILTLVVLVMGTLQIAEKKQALNDQEKGALGFKQIDLINSFDSMQNVLLYQDLAAKYSMDAIMYDLAKNGGVLNPDECGDYQGYNLLNSEVLDCYPHIGAIVNHVKDEFSSEMNSYIENEPSGYLSENNYDLSFVNPASYIGFGTKDIVMPSNAKLVYAAEELKCINGNQFPTYVKGVLLCQECGKCEDYDFKGCVMDPCQIGCSYLNSQCIDKVNYVYSQRPNFKGNMPYLITEFSTISIAAKKLINDTLSCESLEGKSILECAREKKPGNWTIPDLGNSFNEDERKIPFIFPTNSSVIIGDSIVDVNITFALTFRSVGEPPAVTNIVATNDKQGQNAIFVEWDKSPDQTVNEYEIYVTESILEKENIESFISIKTNDIENIGGFDLNEKCEFQIVKDVGIRCIYEEHGFYLDPNKLYYNIKTNKFITILSDLENNKNYYVNVAARNSNEESSRLIKDEWKNSVSNDTLPFGFVDDLVFEIVDDKLKIEWAAVSKNLVDGYPEQQVYQYDVFYSTEDIRNSDESLKKFGGTVVVDDSNKNNEKYFDLLDMSRFVDTKKYSFLVVALDNVNSLYQGNEITKTDKILTLGAPVFILDLKDVSNPEKYIVEPVVIEEKPKVNVDDAIKYVDYQEVDYMFETYFTDYVNKKIKTDYVAKAVIQGIKDSSKKHNINPYVIASIIEHESSWLSGAAVDYDMYNCCTAEGQTKCAKGCSDDKKHFVDENYNNLGSTISQNVKDNAMRVPIAYRFRLCCNETNKAPCAIGCSDPNDAKFHYVEKTTNNDLGRALNDDVRQRGEPLAYGMMMVTLDTSKTAGCDKDYMHDYALSIDCGARVLKTLVKNSRNKVTDCDRKWTEEPVTCIASGYNAGPNRNYFDKNSKHACFGQIIWECLDYGGFAETRKYVKGVKETFNTMTSAANPTT